MRIILWVTTSLLVLHACQGYILLTANMEDVHAIAKQVLASPVGDQLGRIWRRASSQFQKRLREPRQKRIHEGFDNGGGYLSDSFRKRGRRVLSDLAELSQNASVYLRSLRRAFNEIVEE